MTKSSDTPVSVSIARKVTPGAETQYEDWLHRISEVANTYSLSALAVTHIKRRGKNHNNDNSLSMSLKKKNSSKAARK